MLGFPIAVGPIVVIDFCSESKGDMFIYSTVPHTTKYNWYTVLVMYLVLLKEGQ